MQRDVKFIVRELEEILQRIGGGRVEYVPHGFDIAEEKDLNSAAEVEELFHASGLLIYLQNPVFIYIRDHTVGTYSNARERHKIHFSVCSTLRKMKKEGRFGRYRRTTRVNDVYLIDVDARPGQEGVREVPLYPCKHCLAEVDYLCYKAAHDQDGRQRIVEEFKAREAFDFLRQQFALFESETSDVQSANLRTGYSRSWRRRSQRFRKLMKFTCKECGVQLDRDPSLLDVHHLSGDKRDDRDHNLRCLCKLCHARMHSHYNVSSLHRSRILELRRSQGLSTPNW